LAQQEVQAREQGRCACVFIVPLGCDSVKDGREAGATRGGVEGVREERERRGGVA
jgi:hypothetical protein